VGAVVENNLYLLIFIFIILGTSRARSSCGQLINRGVIERNLVRVPDIVVEDPLARVARVALEREHRALTHSSLVAHGINPHQVGTVLTTNSPTRKHMTQLEASGIIVGTETAVRSDVAVGAELVANKIKVLLQGRPLTIIHDGAPPGSTCTLRPLLLSLTMRPSSGFLLRNTARRL
jgi:hypothetical protein